MINAHVTFEDHFELLNLEIERRVIEALDAGAVAMKAVADQQAGNVGPFTVLPARRTLSGWASAISARNPIWRVFDKGSLGRRHAQLKKNRRKPQWPVNRQATTYTAHRQSVDTGGVAARNISSPARAAGRAALLATLRR